MSRLLRPGLTQNAAYELVGNPPPAEMLRITDEVAGWASAGIPRSPIIGVHYMKTKRYRRFCGIDVAKRNHVACINARLTRSTLDTSPP